MIKWTSSKLKFCFFPFLFVIGVNLGGKSAILLHGYIIFHSGEV